MIRKFELIKTYPGFEKLGIVATQTVPNGTKYDLIENDIIIGIHFIAQIDKFPEYWKEISQNDYQIITISRKSDSTEIYSVKDWNGDGAFLSNFRLSKYLSNDIISYNVQKDTLSYLNSNFNIHSVKRLSDNLIFTLGDYIEHQDDARDNGLLENITFSTNKSLLFSYGSSNYRLRYLEEGRYCNGINILKKSNNIPLFLTEDNVYIFKNKQFYRVSSDLSLIDCVLANFDNTEKAMQWLDDSKTFSTRPLAEEYVLENKLSLSLKDIKHKVVYGDFIKLKKLVESKLWK